MDKACDTPLRDMLDEVALDLKNNYISEVGTKQSFNYDVSNNIEKKHLFFNVIIINKVRHFYKKLYFNPGLYLDSKEQWKASTQIDPETRRRRAMSESQGIKPPKLNMNSFKDIENCLE